MPAVLDRPTTTTAPPSPFTSPTLAPVRTPEPAVIPQRRTRTPTRDAYDRDVAVRTQPKTVRRRRGDGILTDLDELARRIAMSTVGNEAESFAVGCRSALAATKFATPIRGMALTLTSGTHAVSATISPNLLLHTYPAMEAMVDYLERNGDAPWQPTGERAISLGAARHLFISHDAPIRGDSADATPNALLEVVAAHLIPAEWFDRVVAPKCDPEQVTLVCYGMLGVKGSLFERAWTTSDHRGAIGPAR